MYHFLRGVTSVVIVIMISTGSGLLHATGAHPFQSPILDADHPELKYQHKRSLNSIGDRVWEDDNMNGIQDVGESGINDVTVNLYEDKNADGLPDQNQPISTTTTSQNGNYQLDQIPDGLYVVEFVPPSGYHPVPANQGNDLNDSDADSSGYSHTLDLGSTHCKKVEDEGLESNGIIGESEYIIEYNEEGEPYIVSFYGGDILNVTIKGGPDTAYYPNPPFQDLQAPFNPNSGKHYPISYFELCFELKNLEAVDAGFYQKASLEGTVWFDYNEDGLIQSSDNREFGFHQWSVSLLQNGQVISSQSTDNEGDYAFSDLDPGTYTVQINPEAGHSPTYDPDGISSPDQASEVLTSNMDRNQFNFGYVGTGTIGNRIWEDENANKEYDAGEHLFEDIQVIVDLANRSFRDTLYTSSDGIYLSQNLSPGTYKVTVDPPQGYQAFYDEDGVSTPNQSTLSLQPGASHLTADFGYIEQGSPLPVRWISFSVHLTRMNEVRMTWTVNDQDVRGEYYEVERSPDGMHWKAIGQRDPKGDTLEKNTYQFTDKQPNCRDNYYRITHKDQDGHSSTSQVRYIDYHCTKTIRISPNPAHSTLTVNFPAEYSGSHIRIYSLNGVLQMEYRIAHASSSRQISIDIGNLHPGQYYLSFSDQNGKLLSSKMLLIRP